MLISAARLVTPARILAPGWLRVEGERIAEVGESPPPRTPDVDLGPSTLVPGFIDAHVHGGGGASYDGGDPASARTVAQTHLSHGTTTIMASLVTDTPASLARSVRALAPLVADGSLAGVHLEGPWLSPRRAGAHTPSLLLDPAAADVDLLVDAGAGALRMVTLAPELPGGLDAVRRLVTAGVTVAVGHTDATYDQTRAALDAGATVGTHLFNAMRAVHHREPGPVTALLEDAAAYVELIADGVHLHPSVLALAAAGDPERTVLVTDAMAAAGAADGDYVLGGLSVIVRDGVARLAGPDSGGPGGPGAIAGSTLTMDAAVRYAVQVAGVPLLAAVRAATSNPARMLGLDGVGALERGGYADLVALDDELRVERVLRRGSAVRLPDRVRA